MKILSTTDWQVSWTNLDKCEELVNAQLDLCRTERIKTLFHLGDIKHHYNPVDVRVGNFMVKTIKKFNKAGVTVYAIIGNHDKIGMSAESGHWGPLLQAAGAIVVSKPRHYTIEGHTLFAVPFSNDPSALKATFKRFATLATRKSVLLFHNELDNCKLNAYAKGKFDLKAHHLYPDRYGICLGGHIHMYQQVTGNVWYIGSPFCHDWGEVNQKKYMVVLDLATMQLQKYPSPIPGLFDPKVPGFYKPKTWRGATIRIQVTVEPGEDPSKVIADTRESTKATYKHGNVVVFPKFRDDKRIASAIEGTADEEIVRSYIAQTCPDSISVEQSVAYIMYHLAKANFVRTSRDRVEFLSATGRNFLSFKRYRASFSNRKLVVVSGKNEDWPNRKNGSGKTCYLQPPAVALFGRTMKGQQHDAWARRQTSKPAWLKLRMRVGKKIVEVFRGRRPSKLSLTVNGKDRSTGIGPRGTQAAIEQVTGLSWETLVNAIYVDQAKVTTILSGTDANRKSIFAQFLSLNRFEVVRDAIADELKKIKLCVLEATGDLHQHKETIKEHKHTLQSIAKPPAVDPLRRKLLEFKVEAKALLKEVSKIPTMPMSSEYLQGKSQKYQMKLAVLQHRMASIHQAISRLESLGPTCDECQQAVSQEHLAEHLKKHRSEQKIIGKSIGKYQRMLSVVNCRIARIESDNRTAEDLISRIRSQVADLEARKAVVSHKIDTATQLRDIRRTHLDAISRAYVQSTRIRAYLDRLRADRYFLGYCISSMSKKGLPAHLAYQLCPRLNSAASYYSDIFSEGEIQVSFQMEEQDIDVAILNVHGGTTIQDQSGGETRLAGLITSFAIAEVVSPCNILILDEPSESLDDHNASVFAAGLQKVSKRIGSIFLCTHNPYILSALESEEQLTIRKSGSVSYIQ